MLEVDESAVGNVEAPVVEARPSMSAESTELVDLIDVVNDLPEPAAALSHGLGGDTVDMMEIDFTERSRLSGRPPPYSRSPQATSTPVTERSRLSELSPSYRRSLLAMNTLSQNDGSRLILPHLIAKALER